MGIAEYVVELSLGVCLGVLHESMSFRMGCKPEVDPHHSAHECCGFVWSMRTSVGRGGLEVQEMITWASVHGCCCRGYLQTSQVNVADKGHVCDCML